MSQQRATLSAALAEQRRLHCAQEARSALAMNNMSVMGSIIKVELAASARKASPQGAPDPFAAMQAHQLAQLQLVRHQEPAVCFVPFFVLVTI